MKTRSVVAGVILVVAVVLVAYTVQAQNNAAGERREAASAIDPAIANHARQTLENGRRVFRLDTFGSEAFWGETLQLHRAIASAKNGGVGDGVSPKTALSVGLKVDADALPAPLKRGIKDGKVDLDDPATTLALLTELGRWRHGVVRQPGEPRLDGTSVRPLPLHRGRLLRARDREATCHVPPLLSEPGNNLHAPSEIGVDSFQADRSPTHMYRTAPLAGLWTHQKGGFYHDGRFATLRDVLEHYDAFFKLGLSEREKTELTEYLKSL